MPNFSVPSIFWITLAGICALLTLATLLGRACSELLPNRFKAPARFYLAPVLGLALLTIIASLIGRFLPLGNSIIVPCLIITLFVGAILCERQPGQAFRHALLVSVFGMVCGISLLGPLFMYGAFNPHNDAFTYLMHANWLQEHAFGEAMPVQSITPLGTQILMYQEHGFRMGGSFLLALSQALLNLRWSFEVYPAVVIAAITACCLAIGFPLTRALRPLRPAIRLALLALPTFTLGGLVFGANLGFLPQTIGLGFGAGLLFIVGALFQWASSTKASRWAIVKAAILPTTLITATTFAYSEIVPFLLVAIVGSGLILAYRHRAWANMIVLNGTLFGFTIVLLNTELIRTYTALRTQSGAVVGSPVDWTLLGFISHAFGLHGGAWDGYQWTNSEIVSYHSLIIGTIILGSLIGILVLGSRSIWRDTSRGLLMPLVIVLIVFAAGILYFRYCAQSPFLKGMGQSWSQFKLSDWAHPFLMAPVLLSIAALRPRLGKWFDSGVLMLFVIGSVGAIVTGLDRAKPLMNYYSGVNDLNRFYLEFRKAALSSCPQHVPIYLALGGENLKFRQMATLFLYDRDVRSDWSDDIYISPELPVTQRIQEVASGNCLIEPFRPDGLLIRSNKIGTFQIGVFDGHGQIRIAKVVGAYGRESDGNNWWHWVERTVSFKLLPLFVPKEATQTKLHFEYGTRGQQILTMHLIKRDGSSETLLMQSKDDATVTFEKTIDVPPNELLEVSIDSDGRATPLGEKDSRAAAWVIRNLAITPVLP